MMRSSQPVNSTATVRLEARLCRCAFSDAGHSVTSGLSELAAILHLDSGVGSAPPAMGAGVGGSLLPSSPPQPTAHGAQAIRSQPEVIRIKTLPSGYHGCIRHATHWLAQNPTISARVTDVGWSFRALREHNVGRRKELP